MNEWAGQPAVLALRPLPANQPASSPPSRIVCAVPMPAAVIDAGLCGGDILGRACSNTHGALHCFGENLFPRLRIELGKAVIAVQCMECSGRFSSKTLLKRSACWRCTCYCVLLSPDGALECALLCDSFVLRR